MTFYKELEKALDNKGEGGFVLVQRGDKKYCIFSPIKDSLDYYRDSGWCMTEKIVKKNIGLFTGYTEEGINTRAKEENWKIIKTYSLRDLIKL